ncbi:hypothetical protein [Arthrobacter flavus]|uniref:Glycoside hydrolase family 65 n=1 Tax=Arthrobacter flavus TaxID=95172 RepID=A0ABW4Q6J1_9MICC
MDTEPAGDLDSGESETESWLRANPHRLDLGRLGFCQLSSEGRQALAIEALQSPRQVLDLWHGVVASQFRYGTHQVKVDTACHPTLDLVAVSIRSSAFADGLALSVAFPYGSSGWCNAADWNSAEAHSTVLEQTTTGWIVNRTLDESTYSMLIHGEGLVVDLQPDHTLVVSTASETLDATFHFLPGLASSERAGDSAFTGGARKAIDAAKAHWPKFWSSGGAIQLHQTDDPRAEELERRIILSQYVTAVNCSGSMPPQETGLVCNSWRGKFHLEMHWWHAAHFAQWGRSGLLTRSLGWYKTILSNARDTARAQHFAGVRWPKQVGPDGRESPSHIGAFLIWQQPHLIYLTELLYRADPSRELLEEYEDLVFETAQFMASFAYRTDRGFELGPPLIPAQESYASTRSTAQNPTFELAYWQWALDVASMWRERLGRDPIPHWTDVSSNMVQPMVLDGIYTAIDRHPYTIRKDHPSMLCAFGFLPATALINIDTMRSTLQDVLADWDWDSTWGWDYPVIAMTAARTLNPEAAVDALLMPAAKNDHLLNGHNRQTNELPIYLPGNGGLLSAVALMAAGWDGCPDRSAPGFPSNWSVQWEGLVPAP